MLLDYEGRIAFNKWVTLEVERVRLAREGARKQIAAPYSGKRIVYYGDALIRLHALLRNKLIVCSDATKAMQYLRFKA